MHNFWLIARHEYLKLAGRRGFIIGTLAIPLLIVVYMGFMYLVTTMSQSDAPIGVVDSAGVLSTGILPVEQGENLLELRMFADESQARNALEGSSAGSSEGGKIQAYYVIPADYIQTRSVSLYYLDSTPRAAVQRTLQAHLLANLTGELTPVIAQRLASGPEVTLRSPDGSRQVSEDSFLDFMIPFAAGFMFIMAVMSSAGYLLQVVSDEKENRMVEVMITTVSPEDLIGGKAVGLMGVALTQILTWIISALVALGLANRFMEAGVTVSTPLALILVVGAFFLPSYALIAGVMTAIGGAVTELRQAQQIAGVINLLFMVPFFFVMLIMSDPNSPILIGLTLFPTTAFATIALRWSFSVIPTWQLLASWFMLTSTAIFSLWASARIFRAGMLQYGQNLNLRNVLLSLRHG
jgi:ABC-2 type transport system permease protein